MLHIILMDVLAVITALVLGCISCWHGHKEDAALCFLAVLYWQAEFHRDMDKGK